MWVPTWNQGEILTYNPILPNITNLNSNNHSHITYNIQNEVHIMCHRSGHSTQHLKNNLPFGGTILQIPIWRYRAIKETRKRAYNWQRGVYKYTTQYGLISWVERYLFKNVMWSICYVSVNNITILTIFFCLVSNLLDIYQWITTKFFHSRMERRTKGYRRQRRLSNLIFDTIFKCLFKSFLLISGRAL